MFEYYPFDLIPLRYGYEALEPHISAETLQVHHDKHLGGGVDSLNSILTKFPQYQKWPLERLIRGCRTLLPEIQAMVKNSAACVFNHNFLFNIMGPEGEQLDGPLQKAVDLYFGSMQVFKDKFKESALKVYGSGYTWLAMNGARQLSIVNSTDCILNLNANPILVIDMWEHAYYLQYQHRKADYIDACFNTFNWPSAQAYYNYYITHNH